MTTIRNIALAFFVFAAAAFAQLTTTQTSFTAAVTQSQTSVTLASSTGVVATGGSSTQLVGSYIWADGEAMQVGPLYSAQGCTSNCIYGVRRGVLGTKQAAHATTAIVYVANVATNTGDSSHPFASGALIGADPPYGSCIRSAQYSLPVIATVTARVWDCPATGPLAGQWAVVYDPTATFSISDGAMFVPFTACQSSVSGNSSGTNGYTVAGTANVGVVQASTSSTGTNTHTYVCHVPIPTRLRGSVSGSGAGAAISDVVFLYGVQSAALGTQAATLASGTFNSSTVFGKVTLPTPAASETASTVAPARADSGSLTITPAAASFNTATTTAGAFYTARFTPATPILMNSDLTDFTFTVTLQCAATTATVTNSPGIYVHIIGVPL